MNYYFTFGTSSSFPYRGGWVEVHASHFNEALAKFRARFPDRTPGIFNYASDYSEDCFISNGYQDHGNLGAYCHEIIE